MPPAARVGDMHTCPMVDPGPKPHVGGPILPPGCPTTLIGALPAARQGDMALCIGPPDSIAKGSPTVFIGSQMAARLGDPTVHGGVITVGCPTVLIGEMGAGGVGGASPIPGMSLLEAAGAIEQALQDQRALLEAKKAELQKWDAGAQANFQPMFGSTDEAARQQILQRIDKMLELNRSLTLANFAKADPEKDGRFAYVYPDDADHKIYLDKAFASAPKTGQDSQAGTLAHEMSHFDDIGATDDHVYGPANAKQLAQTDPAKALGNADNFEYYLEGVK